MDFGKKRDFVNKAKEETYGKRPRKDQNIPLVEGASPSSLPYVLPSMPFLRIPDDAGMEALTKEVEEGGRYSETPDTLKVRKRVFDMLKNLPTSKGRPLTMKDIPDLIVKKDYPSSDYTGYADFGDKYNNAYLTRKRDVGYDDTNPSDREIATHELIHGTTYISDLGTSNALPNRVNTMLPDVVAGYRSPFYKDGKERIYPSWTTNARKEEVDYEDAVSLTANSPYDTYLALNAPVLDKEIEADVNKAEEELPWYARPIAPLIRGKVTLPSEHINVEEMHKRNLDAFEKKIREADWTEQTANEKKREREKYLNSPEGVAMNAERVKNGLAPLRR